MTEKKQFQIPFEAAGKRLDQVLADLMPEYSRSRLQQWLKKGRVLVDNEVLKPKTRVLGGENLAIRIEQEAQGDWQAEAIPLDIIYEDDSLLVINKPVGLVVHPAAGNYNGTLLNALLYHCRELENVPRAGIVHRLDKDTSGILVIAKTLAAQTHLVNQLQQRAFEREYEAVVTGEMTGGGTVDKPIGRHPVQRTKMAVVSNGKPAITHYRIKERFRGYTRIQVKLETGRTHQIRVHMAYLRYPLVGDPVYGGRLKMPPDCPEPLQAFLLGFRRQALHALRLGLSHPDSGEWLSWETPVAEDMQRLNSLLRDYSDAS